MFHVVYDAVRVAKREIDSARPDAPIVEATTPERAARFAGTRRSVATVLHQMAERIAPRQQQLEPQFVSETCSC